MEIFAKDCWPKKGRVDFAKYCTNICETFAKLIFPYSLQSVFAKFLQTLNICIFYTSFVLRNSFKDLENSEMIWNLSKKVKLGPGQCYSSFAVSVSIMVATVALQDKVYFDLIRRHFWWHLPDWGHILGVLALCDCTMLHSHRTWSMLHSQDNVQWFLVSLSFHDWS